MVANNFGARLAALGLTLPPAVVQIANSNTRPVRRYSSPVSALGSRVAPASRVAWEKGSPSRKVMQQLGSAGLVY